MLKVGLTGSIAVGKSFVLEVFRDLGCFVLDADQTARDVVQPGEPAFEDIVRHFGSTVVGSDARLDRSKLGAIVFADVTKLELLNSIVHPRVIDAQNAWLSEVEKQDPGGMAIVDAALMIESGGYRRFDKLIVVWCEPTLQLEHLRSRDNLDEIEAKKRISAQMTQDEKKRYADFLIDTSKSHDNARSQTIEIFSQLKLLL
ncbi:MAG: dephospho-CoA kinase [Pyrinomonadaceae bacterium]